MKNSLLCAMTLSLALPAAGVGWSQDVPAVGVRYDDLDLSRPGGAEVMFHRLGDAAMEACGASDFSLREYRLAVLSSRCYVARLGQAVAELNAPKVTELYDRDALFMPSAQ